MGLIELGLVQLDDISNYVIIWCSKYFHETKHTQTMGVQDLEFYFEKKKKRIKNPKNGLGSNQFHESGNTHHGCAGWLLFIKREKSENLKKV